MPRYEIWQDRQNNSLELVVEDSPRKTSNMYQPTLIATKECATFEEAQRWFEATEKSLTKR